MLRPRQERPQREQDWGGPVRLTEGGAGRLPLVLAGMDGATDEEAEGQAP
ncbi:hypothetical protein [Streptomyces sp. HD]|nr:hypothetical protein [Streptomyces sp. HD]MDC0770442.1 hypothetical protein [Streptomyces sp. HD]